MEKIIINEDNLEEKDIHGEEVRVKAFIKNSDDELLVIHNNKTYQLPGGHNVEGESLQETIMREIKEETGIDIEITKEPFMEIVEYNKNFLNTGYNISNTIYYFEVETDDLPEFSKLNLTELESRTELKINYVKLSEIEDFIEESKSNKMMNELIAYELVKALKTYKEIIKNRRYV